MGQEDDMEMACFKHTFYHAHTNYNDVPKYLVLYSCSDINPNNFFWRLRV